MPAVASPVVFGPYHLDTDAVGEPVQIGAGAFGFIYLATDQTDGRRVAIKVLQENMAGQQGVRDRFLAETSEQSRFLNHAGIIRVFESGEQDGLLWFAMEYCAGGDLGKYVAQHGLLTVAEALKVGKTVADALAYAHVYGICHRDIKPSNILIEKDGSLLPVKLSDFGLVKRLWNDEGQAARSKSGGYVGTLQFSSPEQIKEARDLDGRGDIYSLGLTLWHALTGSFPLVHPDGSALSQWELMQEHTGPAEFLDRLPTTLPACVRELLGKMMARDREARFANCGQVVLAMEKCLQSLSSSPQAASPAAGKPMALKEFYTTDSFPAQRPLGTLCRGKDLTNGQPIELLQLSPALPAEDLRTIRQNAQRLRRSPHPHLCDVAWRDFREGPVLVRELFEPSVSLQEWIGRSPRPTLAGVAPLLISLASVADHVAALGLPGLEDDPRTISIISIQGADLPHPMLTPRLGIATAEAAAPADEGLTLVNARTCAPARDGGTARTFSAASCFASLAYWIFAARSVAAGAFIAPGAYVDTDRLKRGGNSVLREAIAGLYGGTALEVLHRLCAAENVPFTWEVPQIPIAKESSTSGSTWRPPSARTAPIPQTAPVSRTTPIPQATPIPQTTPVPTRQPSTAAPSSAAGLTGGVGANEAFLRQALEAIEETKRLAADAAQLQIKDALARERAEQEARERENREAEARAREDMERRVREQALQAEEERRKREEAERRAAEAAARAREDMEQRMKEQALQAEEERRKREEAERRAAEAAAAREAEFTRLQAEREEQIRLAREQAAAEAAEKLHHDEAARARLDAELAAEREARRLLEEQLNLLSRQTEEAARDRKAAQRLAERENASAQDRARAEKLADAEARLRDQQQAKLDEAQSVIARLQDKLQSAETLAREAALAHDASAEDRVRLETIEAERKAAADEAGRRAREIQRAREEAQLLVEAEKAQLELARRRREEEEAANQAAAERARADKLATDAAEKRRLIEERVREEEKRREEAALQRAAAEERAALIAAQRTAEEEKAAAFRKQNRGGSSKKAALYSILAATLALCAAATWYFLWREKPLAPLEPLSLTLSNVAGGVNYNSDPAIDADFEVMTGRKGADWTLSIVPRSGSKVRTYPAALAVTIDGFPETIPLGAGQETFTAPPNVTFEITNLSATPCELILTPAENTAPVTLKVDQAANSTLATRLPRGTCTLAWKAPQAKEHWPILGTGNKPTSLTLTVEQATTARLTFAAKFTPASVECLRVNDTFMQQNAFPAKEAKPVLKGTFDLVFMDSAALEGGTAILKGPSPDQITKQIYTQVVRFLQLISYGEEVPPLREALERRQASFHVKYFQQRFLASSAPTRDKVEGFVTDLERLITALREIEAANLQKEGAKFTPTAGWHPLFFAQEHPLHMDAMGRYYRAKFGILDVQEANPEQYLQRVIREAREAADLAESKNVTFGLDATGRLWIYPEKTPPLSLPPLR